MIPVAEFEARGEQQVADLGDGITLTWTPAVTPSSTTGIPPLEAAPQTPPIWIFPPTESAERIIVSPIYPPEYRDLILVFPIGSGVLPLYVVVSAPRGSGYQPAPEKLAAFPDTYPVPAKSSVKGGGKKRARWLDSKGRIYEWDYMHGTVEQYDRQGKHLGEFNANTGERLENPNPKRRTAK